MGEVELTEEPHHAPEEGIPDLMTIEAVPGGLLRATVRLRDRQRVRTTVLNPRNSETPLRYTTNNKYELNQSVVFVDPISLSPSLFFFFFLFLFFFSLDSFFNKPTHLCETEK